MSQDSDPGPEAQQWDRIQADMLEELRAWVRTGMLTPDQYAEAMSAVMAKIREHREQAELRDLWRWADSIEASGDPNDAGLARFVRQFIMQTRESQGKFGPP